MTTTLPAPTPDERRARAVRAAVKFWWPVFGGTDDVNPPPWAWGVIGDLADRAAASEYLENQQRAPR